MSNDATLGKSLTDFVPNLVLQIRLLAIAILCLLISVIVFRYSRSPLTVLAEDGLLIFLIQNLLPTITLLVGLRHLVQFWVGLGKRIEVYEKGIIVHTGATKRTYLWKSFDTIGIRSSLTLGNVLYVGSKSKKKPQIIITPIYNHAQEIMNLILHRVSETLVNDYLRQMQQQESLTLGMLTFTVVGIRSQDGFLAWSDIQDWIITNKQLSLRRKNGSIGLIVSIDHVPNSIVLPTFLTTMIRTQTRIQ